MTRRELKPESISPPFGRYAHGTSVDLGDHMLIVTSGQLGVSVGGSIPEDVGAQADICFANISAILAEDGGRPHDVMRINAFVTDRAYFPEYMAARDRWLADVAVLPASTLVIVSGFTRPEFKVEVEATAVVQKTRPGGLT